MKGSFTVECHPSLRIEFTVILSCFIQDRPMAMPGDDVPVTITLQHDIPVEPEQRFTLRDDHKTVGMGIITGVIT